MIDMQLKLGEKEYNIKFAYKPTLKARLISRVVKAQSDVNNITDDNVEGLEDFLLLIPEMILVGLQKNHSDEFGYDIDTNEGRDEQLDKVFNLMDDYFDDDGDIKKLFEDLESEMVTNGFLAKMFQAEQEKQKKMTEIPQETQTIPQIAPTEN